MAISGFGRPLEDVAKNLAEYFATGKDQVIEQLVEKARREGRSDFEVFREHYGKPQAPTKTKLKS